MGRKQKLPGGYDKEYQYPEVTWSSDILLASLAACKLAWLIKLVP